MIARILRKLIFSALLFVLVFFLRESLSDVLNFFNLYLDSRIRYFLDSGLAILYWLIGAFVIREIIQLIYFKRYVASGQRSGAPKLLKDLLIVAVFFVDILLIMQRVFNQPVTGIWITSGAMALILGFALRNIILDIFSGIAVNIEKPYEIGDWIEIHQRFATESVIGRVMDISWRATHIQTEENNNVVIPNSLMTTMAMTTNFWHTSKPARYEVLITLDFEVSVQRAKKILMSGIMEAAMHDGFDTERPAQVLIDSTGEMGITYKIRYWITPWQGVSPTTSRDVVYTALLKHLEASGITPAYPKEDVYHAPMPVRQLDSNKLEDRSKLLGQVDLFSILTFDEITNLSRKVLRRTFAAWQEVVRQSETGDSMFVILEGLLDVMVKDNEVVVKVATLTPEDYFGEMSMLTGENRSATVVCKTDAVIYEILQKDFLVLMSKRVEIIDQIARKISQRRMRTLSAIESERDNNNKTRADDNHNSILYRIRHFFTNTSPQAESSIRN